MAYLINDDAHLTDAGSVVERQIKITHKGQAHFAGSGPAGETCKTCRHWAPVER